MKILTSGILKNNNVSLSLTQKHLRGKVSDLQGILARKSSIQVLRKTKKKTKSYTDYINHSYNRYDFDIMSKMSHDVTVMRRTLSVYLVGTFRYHVTSGITIYGNMDYQKQILHDAFFIL